jgi:ADP-ribosyl-[dinitrogen reductase] hydrolase
VAFHWTDRIAGALSAYACGDALGVPWEGQAPIDDDVARIESLPAPDDWPRGTTSDDTALTLVVARHIIDRNGAADPQGLLSDLAAVVPATFDPDGRHVNQGDSPDASGDAGVPAAPGTAAPRWPAAAVLGLGPSTRAAIDGFARYGELPTSGGRTNGAPMRALPVGWAVPLDQPERRRHLAVELSRATHPHPDAQVAACVVAACGGWALDGAPYLLRGP